MITFSMTAHPDVSQRAQTRGSGITLFLKFCGQRTWVQAPYISKFDIQDEVCKILWQKNCILRIIDG